MMNVDVNQVTVCVSTGIVGILYKLCISHEKEQPLNLGPLDVRMQCNEIAN